MRSRPPPILLAIVLGSLFASPGPAAQVCDTLGAVGRFAFLARSTFTTHSGGMSPGNQFPVGFIGNVCTDHARVQAIELQPSLGRPYLVATRASGTALRLVAPPPRYSYTPNYIDGEIATGGGGVVGPATFFVNGTEDHTGNHIDTSGALPQVQACRQAMTDAQAASIAFAALPPTQVMGAVRVGRGEVLTIDARGGAVIRMDSLKLEGAPGQCPGYRNICDCFQGSETSRIEFLRNAGDQLVLNVDKLAIGSCARFYIDPSGDRVPTVVNLAGPGKRVTVGFEARAYDVNILAPERTLSVTGAGLDTETQVGTAWVKRARLQGFTYFGVATRPCSASPAFVDEPDPF